MSVTDEMFDFCQIPIILSKSNFSPYSLCTVYSNRSGLSVFVYSIQFQTSRFVCYFIFRRLFLDDITWVDAPTEQYPIAGTSYKVRCKVKANPAPLVDWYKQDARIQDGHGFVKDIDGLLIQNVTAEDDGIYKCRAIVLDTGNIQDRDIRVEVRGDYTIA